MALFEKMDFAMVIPKQDMKAVAALGKDLIKLGAKGVAYGEELITDKDNNPVYECLVIVVDKMPKRAALKFLGKFGKELLKNQAYMLGDKVYGIFV